MTACRRSATSRSRFTPDARRAVRLTNRDREVLCEVFASRLLTREQLMALGFFTSLSRANRTLRRLYDAGLLRRIFSPLAPFGAPAVYGIGAKAAALVAERFGVDPAEVSHLAHKEPGRLLIEHTLAVTAVRLRLLEAAREEGWSLSWTPEWRARHQYRVQAKGVWKERVLKPDAFFRLTTAFGVVSFFLERDLGHVSRPQWQQAVDHYESHAARGLLERAYGVRRCPVLVVTSGGALRLRHLLQAAPKGSDRFLFTTWKAIEEQGILAPIWRCRANAEPVALLSHAHYDREAQS